MRILKETLSELQAVKKKSQERPNLECDDAIDIAIGNVKDLIACLKKHDWSFSPIKPEEEGTYLTQANNGQFIVRDFRIIGGKLQWIDGYRHPLDMHQRYGLRVKAWKEIEEVE